LASGEYTGGNIALGYSRQGARSSLVAGSRASVNYYPTTETALYSYGAFLGGTAPLGRKTTVSAHGRANYSPYYSFGLFPTLGSPSVIGDSSMFGAPTADSATASSGVINYQVSSTLTRRMSERTSLETEYSFQRADFRRGEENNLTTQT